MASAADARYCRGMLISDLPSLFSVWDAVALGLLILLWLAIGWRIETASQQNPSVSVLMAEYRREWMRQMVNRDPRIFDSQILSNLRQGTAFFASASMIAIGGGLALIGNADQLEGVADDLSFGGDPTIIWEIKLIIMMVLVANGFLKFVWANRLFGYCAVLVAAVPNDPSDPAARPRADQAAEINITAARGFNRGLRSVYFALAAAAWLLGPVALIAATVFTTLVLYRREFASQSRGVLMQHRIDHTPT